MSDCGPDMPKSWPKWAHRLYKVVRFVVFGWFVTASCAKHDEGYNQGGNELRRWYCDFRFFLAMLKDAVSVPWWGKVPALLVAVVSYLVVILLGWIRFNYV